jgi:DNA-binding LytR/AlgR family response regulator
MHSAFFVEIEGVFRAIKYDEVLYISGTDKKSKIVTKNKNYTVPLALKDFEEQLPVDLFCRVNAFYIVAVQNIDSFDEKAACFGKLCIPMDDEGFRLLISRLAVVDPAGEMNPGAVSDRVDWEWHLKELRELGYTGDN